MTKIFFESAPKPSTRTGSVAVLPKENEPLQLLGSLLHSVGHGTSLLSPLRIGTFGYGFVPSGLVNVVFVEIRLNLRRCLDYVITEDRGRRVAGPDCAWKVLLWMMGLHSLAVDSEERFRSEIGRNLRGSEPIGRALEDLPRRGCYVHRIPGGVAHTSKKRLFRLVRNGDHHCAKWILGKWTGS